jgi:hypothetical protein
MPGKEPLDPFNRRLDGPQWLSRRFAKDKQYPVSTGVRAQDNPVVSPVNLIRGEGMKSRSRVILCVEPNMPLSGSFKNPDYTLRTQSTRLTLSLPN